MLVQLLAIRSTTLLFVALVASTAVGRPCVAHADALRNVDNATSGGGSGSSDSGGGGSSGSRGGGGRSFDFSDDDECDSHSDSLCDDDAMDLLFVYYTFGLPWSLPRLFDDPSLVGYARRPFADGPGLLRLAPHSTPGTDSQGVRDVALAVDMETGYMLEGVVPGAIAMRLTLPRRFEVTSRVNLLSDVVDPALAAAATAHVAYRFAQGRRFDFRTGVGMRLFALDDVRMGIDFVYAVDTYIARHFVFRIELHAGNADRAFVGQARTTLGAMIGRCELYAGYDHTAYLGDGTRATLGGPVAGLRAWF